MSDQLWTLITLVLGATLALVGGWVESSRRRKWKIEDLKKDRELTSKDYWLNKIEEIAESAGKEFYNTWQLALNFLYPKNKAGLKKAQINFDKHTNYYEYGEDFKIIIGMVQSIHVFGDELLSDSYSEMVNIIEEMSDICWELYRKTLEEGIIQDDHIKYKVMIDDILKKYKECSKKLYRQLMQIRSSS